MSTLVLTSACATTQKFRLTQIIVTAHGVDTTHPASSCKDFILSNQQAKRFFTRAKSVTAIEQKDNYHYSECIVFGRARYLDQPVTWQIRAGGTGSFRLHSGVIVTLLGDPSKQKARLIDKN